MFCCQCNGSCMHVGPHSYCVAHRPNNLGYTYPQPYALPYTISPMNKCGACGSTAISHTDKQCQRNQDAPIKKDR